MQGNEMIEFGFKGNSDGRIKKKKIGLDEEPVKNR